MRIKELIREKGYTQKEFADKLGITLSALNQRIDGNPSIAKLQEIADHLGVELHELFVSKESSDFIAMVSYKDEIKKFNSVKSLKKFLDKI